jgi:hypothetical protein
MATLEFNLPDLEAVLRKMSGDVLPAIRAGATVGIKEEAEATMTTSKESFVPVDDGILRGSGYVEDPQIDGDTVSVKIGFGGPAAAYAAVQHENLAFHHDVGEAKYLERPLMERVHGMAERLAARIAEVAAIR